MKSRMRHSGFSLVELLVVMAIIAIIASISIPLFARSSFLQNTDLQNGSREVYAMLRAAKIYAVNHHVDTAVVYGLKVVPDTLFTGNTKIVSDGVFLARALSPKERRELQARPLAGVPDLNTVYMRVGDAEGEYHLLPEGTCILNMPYQNEPYDTVSTMPGLKFIYVYDAQLTTLVSPTSAANGTAFPVGTEQFAAHVFTSSGSLDAGGAMQRFELKVAPMPDADPQERVATDGSGEVVYLDLDNDGDGDVPDYRYIGVEIKPTMGRVKIASDEDYS